MGRLVYVGGGDEETALHAFDSAGFGAEGGDRMLFLGPDAAARLREADARGEKYVLVHVGRPDGEPGGTYERAHHRVEPQELPELARRLRSRDRLLIRLESFGYKNGLPAGAEWVVDCRFLANPYWVEELRPLDGRDAAVRAFVLDQPAALPAVNRLAETLTDLAPHYRAQGRDVVVAAFGCTGGRHRSVAVAEEVADRLRAAGLEVEVVHRGLAG